MKIMILTLIEKQFFFFQFQYLTPFRMVNTPYKATFCSYSAYSPTIHEAKTSGMITTLDLCMIFADVN